MKFVHSFAKFIQPIRVLLVLAACALLVFGSALPAAAAGSSPKSSPTSGEAQLKDIYDKSEESAQTGLRSMKQVQERANRGINEVQADADANKMKNPANSQNATSVIDKVKDSLNRVTPNS